MGSGKHEVGSSEWELLKHEGVKGHEEKQAVGKEMGALGKRFCKSLFIAESDSGRMENGNVGITQDCSTGF